MSSPRLVIVDDETAAAAECAALIATAANQAIAERAVAHIAFSGGRSPVAMFRQLASETLDWPHTHIFQVDERIVPAADDARSWTRLHDVLLARVGLEPAQRHPMPVDRDDVQAGAEWYGILLEDVVGRPPVFDVVHLGLGSDGHTASLVPGDPVLDVMTADVATTGPYEGHRRMTLTYPALNRARFVVWLVTGADKAQALRRLCAGDRSIPAGRVDVREAVIVADRAAAGA